MVNRERELRVILIGGSSHAGKTTVAQALASRLSWQHISTDSLARHPGRPWRRKPQAVPEHVAEHYLSLSVDELIADVLRHYQRLWPHIESLITNHATDPSAERLILEGSALWPEFVATLELENVAAIWLTAGNPFFQTRIYHESHFAQATEREQAMIQKFLARTQLYNEQMMTAVSQHNLLSLNSETASSPEELAGRCLEFLHPLP